MKKVLFFVESLSGGGAEKVLTDLVSNLDSSKYEITVCSLVDVGVYNDYLKNICTYKAILNNPDESKNSIQRTWYGLQYKLIHILPSKWMYIMFFKEKYDVEVAFIEGFSTKIIASSSNKNSKKVAWVHIDLYANHWTHIEYKNLEEEVKAYRKFDHIISVAKSVQDAFSKRFGISERLKVLYNPVDRKDILEKSLQKINFQKQTSLLHLITVGRLESQKGYDRLLEVVSQLKKDSFEFKLMIVGDGSQRKQLETYIEENDLQNYVTLLGFQTNPYAFINAADAFVCSSRSEGFSTVVTEALILGKPVVATDCSGMTELLGDNEYGMITENNTEALYLGLKKFLKDEQLRSHYTAKSKERGADFDIKKTIKSIEEIL